MSELWVFNDNETTPMMVLDDPKEIAAQLGHVGISFERWETRADLGENPASETILAAYASDIERWKQTEGYQTADVVSLSPDHPERVALREKFLSEHTHGEDEVRFFVEGQGWFFLHIDNEVYALLCCAKDLIRVPANTKHWFDMGGAPCFTCVRLFTNPEGWVAEYTGDTLARHYQPAAFS